MATPDPLLNDLRHLGAPRWNNSVVVLVVSVAVATAALGLALGFLLGRYSAPSPPPTQSGDASSDPLAGPPSSANVAWIAVSPRTSRALMNIFFLHRAECEAYVSDDPDQQGQSIGELAIFWLIDKSPLAVDD